MSDRAGFLPQETIRRQRDGKPLGADEIAAFIDGIACGRIGDAQCAAFAMAVCWCGMSTADCVVLTLAMRDSGDCLSWADHGLHGPVVDKHSSGGIGDTVSLVLGPLLAACGCHVPMISGRGLGHTGGTLDKLEAIPGYTVQPSMPLFQQTVREVGVAIVGAGARLVPADRRLYAIRDITATINSVPLITASILSKKLAAGLGALVLDVKLGNGAFMPDEAAARALATSLVEVGCGAGLPTLALLTDMNQPLAPCAGNALEVRLAIEVLAGAARPERLLEVTFALGAALLVQAGVAANAADARQRLQRALDSGAAAERFARMAAALGGPADLLERAAQHLAAAPVQRVVAAPAEARGKLVDGIDTRELGLAVIRLGGGRTQADARIDPAVGLAELLPLGAAADAGAPLAIVHAACDAAADAAAAAVQAAYRWASADARRDVPPLIVGSVTPATTTQERSSHDR